VTRFSRFRW